MRRAWLILIALALPAARQERLELGGRMVDQFGGIRSLAWVRVGPGITVTQDGEGVMLSVSPPAAERLVLQGALWCRAEGIPLPSAYRVFANGLYAVYPDDYVPNGACLASAWSAGSIVVLERYP